MTALKTEAEPRSYAQYAEMAYTRLQGVVYWLSLLLLAHVCRSALFKRKRDPSAFDTVDDSALVVIIIVFAVGLTIMTHPAGGATLRRLFRGTLTGLVAYYGFCVISSLWSNSFLYSVFRAGEMLVVISAMAMLFAVIPTRHQACKLFFWFAFLSSLMGMAWYIGRFGLSLSQLHSNDFPAAAGIGTVFCFGMMIDRPQGISRSFALVGWLGFMLILALGTSAGSIVAATFGMAIVLAAGKNIGRFTSNALVLGTLMGLLAMLAVDDIKHMMFPGKSEEQIVSFHGRTRVWREHLTVFMQNPIIGKGFPVGEKYGYEKEGRYTNSSHNGFVSVAVNTGSVGIAIFACAVGLIGYRSLHALSLDLPMSRTAIGVLVTACANNMTCPLIGSHWFWPTSVLIAFLSLAAFHIWDPQRAEYA
ncbi:MAG: O-antigen ligase family protein [Pirellulaceae bacterium]|nr:O-antigen ligase family protein [Planctomycetales bacterium]